MSVRENFLNRLLSLFSGWMQLVILIYHYTDASHHSIPIYMFVRVLVSSYVFLNGFGHFFYVWLKGDTGIKRFLQVQTARRPNKKRALAL